MVVSQENPINFYLASYQLCLLFMLFLHDYFSIQYFFCAHFKHSAQEAPAAQGQTVAGASGTQQTQEGTVVQGGLILTLNQVLMHLNAGFFSNQNTSEPF